MEIVLRFARRNKGKYSSALLGEIDRNTLLKSNFSEGLFREAYFSEAYLAKRILQSSISFAIYFAAGLFQRSVFL